MIDLDQYSQKLPESFGGRLGQISGAGQRFDDDQLTEDHFPNGCRPKALFEIRGCEAALTTNGLFRKGAGYSVRFMYVS